MLSKLMRYFENEKLCGFKFINEIVL